MSNIDQWAHREKPTGGVSRANRPLTAPTTLAHRVESEIADRLVMHCGREMRAKAGEPWAFEAERPTDGLWCSQCA